MQAGAKLSSVINHSQGSSPMEQIEMREKAAASLKKKAADEVDMKVKTLLKSFSASHNVFQDVVRTDITNNNRYDVIWSVTVAQLPLSSQTTFSVSVSICEEYIEAVKTFALKIRELNTRIPNDTLQALRLAQELHYATGWGVNYWIDPKRFNEQFGSTRKAKKLIKGMRNAQIQDFQERGSAYRFGYPALNKKRLMKFRK